MTLPSERARAVYQTRNFLLDIAFNKKRMSKEMKEMAKSCLRHFPNNFDLQEISEKCPNLFNMDEIPKII